RLCKFGHCWERFQRYYWRKESIQRKIIVYIRYYICSNGNNWTCFRLDRISSFFNCWSNSYIIDRWDGTIFLVFKIYTVEFLFFIKFICSSNDYYGEGFWTDGKSGASCRIDWKINC